MKEYKDWTMFEKVRDVITQQLGCDEKDVKLESRFEEDLGGDSLDCVELGMAIEEEFDLEVPDEDAEKIETVAQLVTYLEGRKGTNG